MNERIGQARSLAARQAADVKTREHIDSLAASAKQLEEKSVAMTRNLKSLDLLKANMLAALPIPGASIADGDLLINGIKFDRLNMAERMRIAIELAKLKARDLGLILVDEAEHFDSATWDAFRQAATESGLQFVAARVADSDLEVQAQ